jgi:hypothetical protein
MTTGNFTDWTGNMLDIGPLYPFVGWEVLMVVVAFVVWIGWHVLQLRAESRQLEDEARSLREGDNLQRAVLSEHAPERM